MHLEPKGFESVVMVFRDAGEATVMTPHVEHEMKGVARDNFYEDVVHARENPKHRIEVEMPLARLEPVYRKMWRQSRRLRTHRIDDDQVEYNPAKATMTRRQEAYLLAVMMAELVQYLGYSPGLDPWAPSDSQNQP